MRTFVTEWFIWNAKSLCLIFQTHLFPVRLALGFGNLYKKPLRCPSVFIQKFYFNIHAIDTSIPQFTMVFRGTCIIVTPKLISEVLRVPRVAHLNYPSHPHLRSISRDELAFRFYEKVMVWVIFLISSHITLLRVQGSLTWWWPLFSLHSLIITPLLSLMLVFFSISWKVSP